jgi:hypothetical protein
MPCSPPKKGLKSLIKKDNHCRYETTLTIIIIIKVKVKVVPVLNYALRQEDVWRSECIDACFLDLSTSWR